MSYFTWILTWKKKKINIICILQFTQKQHFMWRHMWEAVWKAFSLICDSCLSKLCKISLAQFFNPKLSPEVELDEFNSNQWFNFWHNLLIRIRRKCESKMLVTPPHAFMQQIKYYGIRSWHVCRKLPEVKTEYLSELKMGLQSICYCLISPAMKRFRCALRLWLWVELNWF